MKRWILSIFVLLMFFCLILVGFGSWLLRSTAGAIWLLEAVANVAELQITTGQLEGRLIDDLVVDDLLIAWPDGHVSAQRIHLNWEPFSMLKQPLKIHLLEVDQLLIGDTNSEGSPDNQTIDEDELGFSARDLMFLPLWLNMEISRLQVHGLAYQDEESNVVIADEISGHYLWSQGRINAPEFSYLSPYVHLRGAFDWDLQAPHLEMTADVHLPEVLVDPQLFEDIAVPIDFPGQVVFDGDWNDFSGPVRFGAVREAGGLATEEGDTVWLSADAQGSWRGIRFDNLRGHYLNGSLAGDLNLAWIDSYRMHGQLTGVELDPGILIKDLNGRTSLEVNGELLVSYDERPLQANLKVMINQGHLRGHDIAGQVAVDWQDGGLAELNLDLSSEGARVIAEGQPKERLELDLAISDLQSFHPDLAGQLIASGWLRWADDYLTGDLGGMGTDIVWQETSLASLSFQGQHLTRQTPMELKIDAQGLEYDGQQVDQLQVGLSGTLEKHDVQVAIDGLDVDLTARLTGRYQNNDWHAELQALSGQTPKLGAWALETPAKITWQSGGLSLENFTLSSKRGGRATLEIFEWGSEKTARVALDWQDLNHDWLAYLQSPQAVSGRSSGELFLEMVGQQPVSLKASLTASAELKDELAEVAIPALTAELTWLQDGLNLDLSAESVDGESLEISAHSSQPPDWNWPPDELSLDMHWQELDLSRFSRFQDDVEISGFSEGRVQLEILKGKLKQAMAKITANGLMQQNEQTIGFRSLLAELNWDKKHFLCDAEIEGIHDGNVSLHLTSTEDPHFPWPESGQIDLKVDGINLQSLYPLLPAEADLSGLLHGESSGYWQEDYRIFLDGQFSLSDSEFTWRSEEGQIDVMLEQVDLEWKWQDEHLKGSLAAQLEKEGVLRGRWQLPLPARWPIEFDTNSALQADLQAQFHVAGLLAAVAPGLVQDMRGEIETDLQLTGTWETPVLSGHMALTEAGAYVPSTGVTIEDLSLRAALQDEQISIEEFSLRSGPGTLTGSGRIDFDRWQLEAYHLEVKGDRLQAYNFPELQVLCSPDLTLDGDQKGAKLHGSLLIPEMSLTGISATPNTRPSHDVVVVGEGHDDLKTLPIDADIQVAVELGDQVWVKIAAIKTRLEGGGVITLDERQQLAARGEIRLVDGSYKDYGASLQIKQGVLSYKGGPVTNPRLKIFAAREVGGVQAGVQITGAAEAPVVSLYSLPPMPDRDILGYIFIGRPMREGQEGADALIIGAGAMMPRYGETFAELGISEIDLQGLFDGTGGVRLRKRLTGAWELVSTLGEESGIDLYYVIRFN